MPKHYNSKLKPLARRLRREMTPAEQKLWQVLRGKQIKGIKFRRQVPIEGYIVDFCSFRPKVVIEIDGDTHYSEEGQKLDRERDARLKELGFKIYRFTNREIMENFEGVVEILLKEL